MSIEKSLRRMVRDVERGRLSRRVFVHTLVGMGLTAPMAAQLLATSPALAQRAAHAQAKDFVPTRRGGGGELRVLMWDAPTLLHPHFTSALRDVTASRLFYEPLAAPAPDGTFTPVLASELPSLEKGTVAKDGRWVIWKLKRGVTWHDGAPFTADDVIFNWQFASDAATGSVSREGYLEISKIDKIDSHQVKVNFGKPQPFWQGFFTGEGLLPRHVFESTKGAGAREAIGMIRPVGTGPYKLVEFRPGDVIRAEINPNYYVPNRPFFDRIEIKCGGDAAGAARAVMQTGEYDFAYYILLEEEVLKRIELGGKGRVMTIPSSGVSHIQLNQTDPWTEVDGERSALKAPHPFLSDPVMRTAVGLLVDRQAIQDNLVGRTGQIAVNILNTPDRFRSSNNTWEFSVDKANMILDRAGWARGADGVRMKDGKRLRLVFQATAHALTQKVQAVVKQAAARAGVEVEIKAIPSQIFFSSDMANPDNRTRFLADMQTYATFASLDPQGFMGQFCSWLIPTKENKWTGRNVSRWRNAEYDTLWRKAEHEMDPVKRAAMFIRMNDLVIQSGVIIPITWRNVLHAAANNLMGIEPNSWDSIFASIPYWYRNSV
ncbi:MAG TPA: peptide ABC transporter substrate-binding protein [Methylomirabilota bacterium]|nr:peptide ABC transporter substrate-binding protein [Methylomirabilota bacterium]